MKTLPRKTENKIEFNFTCYALKLLGHNLYSNPWTAVSEIVANGIDAKAKNIYILVDLFNKNASQIEIIDDGYGMSYQDLCDKYTIIGRNKRVDTPDDNSVLGRKGVGKLAALYLSDNYYLFTKTETESSAWYVDVSNAKDEDIPSLERYNGDMVVQSDTIWNNQLTGTAIRLKNVNLQKIGVERLKALPVILSDYYLSDVISCKIHVCIRFSPDQEIKYIPIEKNISFKTMYAIFDNTEKGYLNEVKDFIFLNKTGELPVELDRAVPTIKMNSFEGTTGTITAKSINGEIISAEYSLKGWLGLHGSLNSDIQKRNNPQYEKTQYHPNAIRLYVRGKLAVDDLMPYIKNTQAFANYIEGEISFDILDDDRFEDISTSNREGYKKDDVRVIKLTDIVGKIIQKMISERSAIGSKINNEFKDYLETKRLEEEQKRKSEELARVNAEKAQKIAEEKQQIAEAVANREIKRSQYILNISGVEDKNIMNSIHSIYNMSNRVKTNLDEINNLPELPHACRKKLEKASISNQRILSVSKLISKAGYVIDDNDAVKKIDLTSFISEYVDNVLRSIYSDEEIKIKFRGDVSSKHIIKIKPLSFIMMVDNLIGNAIKANAKECDIIINDSLAKSYQVIFKDNGNGIDDSIDDLNRLFEFGFTTTNGSGLGLYYAKKQMNELNGHIDVKRNEKFGVSIILSWDK